MVKKKVLSVNNWWNVKGIIFDRNITIRYSHKIQIGNKVLTNDDCFLDAKSDSNKVIVIREKEAV